MFHGKVLKVTLSCTYSSEQRLTNSNPQNEIQDAAFFFSKIFVELYFIYYKVHHFKSTVYWDLVFFRWYDCHHSLTLEQFYILPKKTPYPHTLLTLYIPRATPAQGNPLISFLSLWICLLWTLQINGIIQHMAFCDSLLSLNLMLSRFMLQQGSIPQHFKLSNDTPLCACMTFIHLSVSGYFWVVLTFQLLLSMLI